MGVFKKLAKDCVGVYECFNKPEEEERVLETDVTL
jgi:hypothetical protein